MPSFPEGCSTSDNFDGIGRERVCRHDAQADRTDQPSDHDSSLTFLLDWTDDGGTLGLQGRLACKNAS